MELMEEVPEPPAPPELVYTPPLTALKLSGLLHQLEMWAGVGSHSRVNLLLDPVEMRELCIERGVEWRELKLAGILMLRKVERSHRHGPCFVMMVRDMSKQAEATLRPHIAAKKDEKWTAEALRRGERYWRVAFPIQRQGLPQEHEVRVWVTKESI